MSLKREWDRVVEMDVADPGQARAEAKRLLSQGAHDGPDSEVYHVYLLEEVKNGVEPMPTPKDQLPLPLEV